MSTLRFLVVSFAMVLPFTLSDALAREFRLEEYFLGRTQAEGRFSAINGLRRSFTVDLRGSWDGRTLTIARQSGREAGDNLDENLVSRLM